MLRPLQIASAFAFALCLLGQTLRAGDDASAIENRLRASVTYLASDELEGRGPGTKGIDLAADYIAAEFEKLGLKTKLFDGGPYQKFTMNIGANLGPTNSLTLVGPPPENRRIELKLGRDWNPLSLGGSGKFDLPLVFVGYGITTNDKKYDDYAGIDVKDKAVLVLRHEPQQADPHSMFDGTKNSPYAPFVRKVSNAYEHGAAAVIFSTDDFDIEKNVAQWERRWQAAIDEMVEENAKFKALAKPTDTERRAHQEHAAKLADEIKSAIAQCETARDPLVPFDGAGGEEGRNFPVIYCRPAALDPVVKAALGEDLKSLERDIDKGPQPRSATMASWRVIGQTDVVRKDTEVKNVVAVLEGEGPKADETIVIGAHYDHLGYGGPGSGAPGVHEIHNGADDNASGVAVLLEVARELAARDKNLPRRIVFIAFTGEERGLVGSSRYLRNPLFPLDKTIAMLNMDMVGRLRDDKLQVHGTGTAAEFDALADRLGAEFGFRVNKVPGGFGPSDHAAFYGKKIPVLHFFTGNHSDYHRPSDDVDKLNIAGMRRVEELVAKAAVAVAEMPEAPKYRETKAPAMGGGGDRPYFGSIPDFSQDEPGYALMGVAHGGPAEKAGIRPGDIIVGLGDHKIGNLEDFDSALRKFKAGDKVPVAIKRGKEEMKMDVTLEPPRQ